MATMATARAHYEASGGKFFDRDTMKFWGSRIESQLYKNRCFITSENNFDNTKRLYSVRQFNDDFTEVETIAFQINGGKSVAQSIAREVEA